ncbi:hypothetical protein [Bacillus manliponensis]|uniref:hypothetical protein n=1 Tax=Bacillus manliponensis TaxID=574376 RepID=UPI00351954A5
MEYGTPDIWKIGDCTECDAPHRAWYGRYMLNMKMPLDGNSPILYNIELSVYTPVETVKSWIGEPDEVEYGMDSIEMVYKRGDHYLVARYNENTVYFISVYRNGYW